MIMPCCVLLVIDVQTQCLQQAARAESMRDFDTAVGCMSTQGHLPAHTPRQALSGQARTSVGTNTTLIDSLATSLHFYR